MSIPSAESLASALRRLFPERVSVASLAIGVQGPSPFDEEEALINGANAARQEEFRAGRLCAREALRKLGFPDMPILSEENRGPVWPEGVIGSISHTRDYCVAAVAQASGIKSIGLDMEQFDRLRPNLWRLVLTKEEMSWIHNLDEADRIAMAALIFSAKEAFYKYQFPLTKTWLGFLEAEVTVAMSDSTFALRLLREVPPLCVDSVFRGRYTFSGAHILAGIC